MNNPVFLSGLNKIYSKFDIFFVDLWGVVHNGIECYSDALKALKNTKKSKKIILISNAPRPSHSVQKFLNKIESTGVNPFQIHLYQVIESISQKAIRR